MTEIYRRFQLKSAYGARLPTCHNGLLWMGIVHKYVITTLVHAIHGLFGKDIMEQYMMLICFTDLYWNTIYLAIFIPQMWTLNNVDEQGPKTRRRTSAKVSLPPQWKLHRPIIRTYWPPYWVAYEWKNQQAIHRGSLTCCWWLRRLES